MTKRALSVPPGGQAVGSLVLIFQVVGMLPDVDAEDRRARLVHQRVVLVRRGGDPRDAVGRQHVPGPTAAEARHRGLVDLLLHPVQIAERGVNRLDDLSARFAARWTHDRPERGIET